ncbi:MFS transporter [Leptospira sp. GIMC2001]|uniref:MFS transporter n=1 Tax=Leptospira sp. GIMC2001 TaxID=1513297 RepID=UPI00234BFF3D|nr:MFS transporter [Leptospira sp. GIMC2001]WCL49499.1 MFS transporter [Leptospira sp. GIMC2001]
MNHNRDKLYLFSASLGLLSGNMFNYSIIIFSHSLSDQKSFASLVFFIAYLPFLFLSFRAGFILDKYPRKYVIGISQLIAASSAFIPGLLSYFGILTSENKELLFVFAFTNGIGMSFLMPGRFAILGDLVDSSKITKSTISLNKLLLLGFTVAPILAGLIREIFSYGTLLMITGSIYYVSTIVLFFITVPHFKQDQQPLRKAAMEESFAFVKSENRISQALIAMFIAMVSVGTIQVLLPEFGKKDLALSESGRGMMMGLLGIGLMSGAFATALIMKFSSRGKFILNGLLIGALFFLGIGLSKEIYIVFPLLLIVGFFVGSVTTFIPSVIQECTPNQLRGRVMSFYTLIFLITPAISGLCFGKLTDFLSLSETIFISGIVSLMLGIIGFVCLRSLRMVK